MTAGDCLLMTREYDHAGKTALLSWKITSLIKDFFTYKFSNTFKV